MTAQLQNPAQSPKDPLVDLSNLRDMVGVFGPRTQKNRPSLSEQLGYLDMTDPYKDLEPKQQQSSMQFVTRDRFPKDENDTYQSRNTVEYSARKSTVEKPQPHAVVEQSQRQSVVEQPEQLANVEKVNLSASMEVPIKATDLQAMPLQDLHALYAQLSQANLGNVAEPSAFNNSSNMAAAVG